MKHTPSGHPDRFPLQMALTQLEFVASTLNEQKRAIESYLCVRDIEKRMVDLEEVSLIEPFVEMWHNHVVVFFVSLFRLQEEALCSKILSSNR